MEMFTFQDLVLFGPFGVTLLTYLLAVAPLTIL